MLSFRLWFAEKNINELEPNFKHLIMTLAVGPSGLRTHPLLKLRSTNHKLTGSSTLAWRFMVRLQTPNKLIARPSDVVSSWVPRLSSPWSLQHSWLPHPSLQTVGTPNLFQNNDLKKATNSKCKLAPVFYQVHPLLRCSPKRSLARLGFLWILRTFSA